MIVHHFVHRSDRKRYTAKQRSQAMMWTLIAAVTFVAFALLTVH
jgi:hypothetical protein